MPLPVAVGLTMYLALLLLVRINWGFGRSLRIAVSITGLLVALCLAAVVIVGPLIALTFPPYFDIFFVGLLVVCAIGIVFGVGGCLIVHGVVRAVDWLDNLMATKPPRDE